MGSPRQEFWIGEQMLKVKTHFCMGVGGSFDMASGVTKRAPALFRKTGTEWLYRLLVQPAVSGVKSPYPCSPRALLRSVISPR